MASVLSGIPLPLLLSAAGLLAVALVLWLWRRWQLRHPYQQQPLFSDDERAFLPMLEEACADQYRWFAKVRWADLIATVPALGRGARQQAFAAVCARRFDYVLCRQSDLSVALILERLPEGKLGRAQRRRNRLLGRICQQIQLPLLVLKHEPALTALHLRSRIESAINKTNPALRQAPGALLPAFTALDAAPAEGEKCCPKCQSPLVPRVAQKGQHAGQAFLTCSAYPLCKTVLGPSNNEAEPQN